MSHKATNWAIQQRGLKPAAKIVLWHLCDRHNPDLGCFPSQQQLAYDCEMSVSSLNDQLARLEEAGLIHRVRRVDERTRQQQSTRYILGFEPDFPQAPPPKIGDGKPAEPSPNSAESRLRNSETNLVREPVNTTPRQAPTPAEAVERCLKAAGPGMCRNSRAMIRKTDAVVARWLEEGFDLELDIVPTVGVRTDYLRESPIRTWEFFTKAIAQRHRGRTARRARPPEPAEKREAASASCPDSGGVDPVARIAGWINEGRYVPTVAITNTMRDKLLERGLVTREQLRELQVY